MQNSLGALRRTDSRLWQIRSHPLVTVIVDEARLVGRGVSLFSDGAALRFTVSGLRRQDSGSYVSSRLHLRPQLIQATDRWYHDVVQLDLDVVDIWISMLEAS